MNNNFFNFNPNSFVRNVPNMGFNPMNSTRFAPRALGLPRLSSLFSGGSSAGLLGGARAASSIGATSKLSFSSILTGAGKTLGVINQAIPVFYQVKPIWNNAKTMFRVVKEMKTNDTSTSTFKNSSSVNDSVNNSKNIDIPDLKPTNVSNEKKESNSPTFFI